MLHRFHPGTLCTLRKSAYSRLLAGCIGHSGTSALGMLFRRARCSFLYSQCVARSRCPILFFLPGLALAVWKRRYEIALLAIVPIVGAYVANAWENRLLLAIPFWMILMAFSFAGLVQLKLRPGPKVIVWGIAAFVIWTGLFPSVRYIYAKAKSPTFNWLLRSARGRGIALYETRCCRNKTGKSASPGTQRVQSHSRNSRAFLRHIPLPAGCFLHHALVPA